MAPYDPGFLFVLFEAETGVDRTYDKIKLFQDFLVIIEAAVRKNITFNPLEYVEIFLPLVEGVNDLPLPRQILNLEPSGVEALLL